MTGIHNLQTLLLGAARTDASEGGKRSSQAASPTDGSFAASTDRSVVSAAASSLSSAIDADDIRADKVAALKSAIDAGTYQVPASKVADSLLAAMLSGPPAGRG